MRCVRWTHLTWSISTLPIVKIFALVLRRFTKNAITRSSQPFMRCPVFRILKSPDREILHRVLSIEETINYKIFIVLRAHSNARIHIIFSTSPIQSFALKQKTLFPHPTTLMSFPVLTSYLRLTQIWTGISHCSHWLAHPRPKGFLLRMPHPLLRSCPNLWNWGSDCISRESHGRKAIWSALAFPPVTSRILEWSFHQYNSSKQSYILITESEHTTISMMNDDDLPSSKKLLAYNNRTKRIRGTTASITNHLTLTHLR